MDFAAQNRFHSMRWPYSSFGGRGRANRGIVHRACRSPNCAEQLWVRRVGRESVSEHCQKVAVTLSQPGPSTCPHQWPYCILALFYGERVAAAHGLRVARARASRRTVQRSERDRSDAEEVAEPFGGPV